MSSTDNRSPQAQAAAERPDPTTLEEALARINTFPAQAWQLAVQAKWGFSGNGDCPYEYDQDDTLVVGYDDLYDLANIALAAMKLAGFDPEAGVHL